MADEADRAQDLRAAYERAAIQSARRQMDGEGSSHCVDCDEEIPVRRREKVPNAVRCVECQTIFEQGGS